MTLIKTARRPTAIEQFKNPRASNSGLNCTDQVLFKVNMADTRGISSGRNGDSRGVKQVEVLNYGQASDRTHSFPLCLHSGPLCIVGDT